MLYLEAPFHTIEGVVVFRDHAVTDQWYFLPGSPRLTTSTEPDPDGPPGAQRRVPALSLIKFKGTAGTGGFLNFDVDLGIDPDRLDEVAAAIKRLEQLPDRPRLAPVPVVDGSVRLMLFDKQTPPEPPRDGTPPPPAPPPELQFVLTLTHPAKPALYGDNRATFSAQLTQEGVTTLEKAMQGELSPIGVVYSLDYLGLRPAYHVSVHVDWDAVQKHLEESETISVPLIYSSSIEKVVDELVEQRIIEITADTFVLEEDGSAVIARRDEALADVKDMITETFFEPTLSPIDSSDDVDTGVRTAGRVLQAILSGGASETSLFRRKEVDIQRIEKKRLDVAMSERTTVKRTIFPQGHLSGLFRTLTLSGVDLSRFVIDVDLDDPWFQRRTVEVISRAEYSLDSVRSVNVTLSYGGEVRSALLTSDAPRATVSWASRLAAGAMIREVDTSFQVNFAGVDGTERPTSLSSAPGSLLGDALEIDPRELYAISPIPVVALSYPWERYPHVEVEVAYADPANQIAQSDVLLLSSEKTEALWNMFVRDPQRTGFRYRVTHRALDQRDHQTAWIETDEERINIRDPFPNGRVLDVVPVLDWTVVKRAFVDLSYRDDPNGILEEDSLEFTKETDQTQQFRVRLADVTQREVGYRVTLINLDGSVVEIPPSVTLERRVTLRGDMAGHQVIRIRSQAVDYAAVKVRQVSVDLRYLDAAHGLQVFDNVVLRSGADEATFEFDYVADGPAGFEYQVVTTFTNNLTRTRPWAPADESRLVIAVP